MNKKIAYLIVLCVFWLAPSFDTLAANNLILQYSFDSSSGTTVYPSVGTNNATLVNNAEIKTYGSFKVLDLGSSNGYLDLGSGFGAVISGLTDFTFSTYIYVDATSVLTNAGNFIFTFSNSTNIASDKNGCMFLSARNQRYAISKTHWSGESGIETGTTLETGTWKHVVYVQDGITGKLYIDGQMVKSGLISIYPKDLGRTLYNFIGRSPYVGDSYLKNARLTDIRVYNSALSATEINTLAQGIQDLENVNAAIALQEAVENLVINGGSNEAITSFTLPTYYDGNIRISWTSSDENHITSSGLLTRPAQGENPVQVVLTATVSKGSLSETKSFTITVIPQLTNVSAVEKDLLTLQNTWSEDCVGEKLTLPKSGPEGSIITWTSNNPDFISDQGIVRKLSPNGQGTKPVQLTATLTKGSESISAIFNVCVKEDEGYSAYLFAYFTGNSVTEEAIRFGLSRDGYNYRALNNNNAIIGSDSISDMGGVRDPHILRGEDANFYMVVTDMRSSLGWSSNHGIVLLKSSDLINWTHSKIDIKAKYPAKFGSIQSAWAPQTIYDAEVGKYMIYWSMRSPGVHEIIYYAYANADFTDIEGEPKILYSHPDSKSTIDGDIIYKDGKYNLFFKTEGDGNGIKKAVSDRLTGEYVMIDKYLQQTTQSVEGSCVFRLINSDKYILMYDVYNNGRYEFTESTDLETFTKIDDDKISMDFHPRHGTVIPITEEEGNRLVQKWGQSLSPNIISSNSSAVKLRNWIKDDTTGEIFLPVKNGTTLTDFDPELVAMPGSYITPSVAQNFSGGSVTYTSSLGGQQKTYNVTAQVNNNPVLDGFYADPQVLYAKKTNKYYIYPTSDGFTGWGGYYFKAFSSDDLINWTDEGVILDLSTEQVGWADANAWAPAIVEKEINGEYKYYFYYSANPIAGGGKAIGVAVADFPTGPFVDSGKAIITASPTGSGQQIDPAVFIDPVSGKNYIFWGNGYMAGAELNDDMLSIKESTITVMTPDNSFREGVYVIYRNGLYYYFWSEDDTGSENYKVRYGTSTSPLGNITVPANNIVIQKNIEKEIYATGHNSILQIPDKDEYYIVYHRFTRPRLDNPGVNREVCIDKLEFNSDASVKETIPTLEGIVPLISTGSERLTPFSKKKVVFYPNPTSDHITVSGMAGRNLTIVNLLGKTILAKNIVSNQENIDVLNLVPGVYVIKTHDLSNQSHSAIMIKH